MTKPDAPEAGMRAQWPGFCEICAAPIAAYHDRIVFQGGRPVHVECFARTHE